MATSIRAEVSKNNKYWINKHRHYELKHFCLQYPLWKKLYKEIDGYGDCILNDIRTSKTNIPSDPTFNAVTAKLEYLNKMKLVEQTAIATDVDLSDYILKAVTEGLSYTILKTKLNIPCSRDTYYDRYRKFFWLLDSTKN